tara:strand:- start:275 stop:466 length:192 start_codon:yes stop_codon:yes gene_type:complete
MFSAPHALPGVLYCKITRTFKAVDLSAVLNVNIDIRLDLWGRRLPSPLIAVRNRPREAVSKSK